MNFSAAKGKDARPLDTIRRIKDILGEMELLPVEMVWRNSVEGFYSVAIQLAGTDLSTNGKGVSPEYALASAYGEMMERLQNQCVYRLGFDLSPEALAYKGFYYAPDEKGVSAAELLASQEDWMSIQWSLLPPDTDKAGLLELWREVSYEQAPADFIALPYCNLSGRTISHIPIKMISKMYMSNGMCAGNTPEEAIVQGLSEILERYVNTRILKDKVVPPTVPREYIAAHYPAAAAMIAAIEAKGNFAVLIKECSLGMGIPAVGVVFIDRDAQSYFVKFGAHPFAEIALERTLTELLQGQDIGSMLGTREFAFAAGADDPDNRIGILVHGSGLYPDEFFGSRFSYEFSGIPRLEASGNKELLAGMIAMLAGRGFSVFARDVSFLGFPSYHVIVPGMSEVETFGDIRAIREYAAYNKVRRLLRDLENLSSEGAAEIVAFLSTLPYNPQATVAELLNLPLARPVFPWYCSNLDLLLTLLYCRQGDFSGAHEVFMRFVEYTRRNSPHHRALTYYKCVRDFLGGRAKGLTDGDIAAALGGFYPAEVIAGAVREFSDPAAAFAGEGSPRCWNCGTCPFAAGCLYKPMERVYKIMKERYARAGITQAGLLAAIE